MCFGYKNKMFYVPYFLSKRWDTDGPTRPKMCTEAVLQQTEAVLQQIVCSSLVARRSLA